MKYRSAIVTVLLMSAASMSHAARVEAVFADDIPAIAAREGTVIDRILALRPAVDAARRRTHADGFVVLAKTAGAYHEDRMLNIGIEGFADDQIRVCRPEEAYDLINRLSKEKRVGTNWANIPVHRWNIEYWRDRVAAKQREILANESREFDAVFIGDSITHNWESENAWGVFKEWGGFGKAVWDEAFKDFKVLNLGISADGTQHVIWRLENGELDNYRAKMFVIMIGTNNSRGRPEDTSVAVKRIIELVQRKHPAAKIVLYSVFPRGRKPDDVLRGRNEKLNGIIREYADGKRVIWRDINSKLVNPDGTIEQAIMPDYLHPSPKGYKIWADDVLPLIREFTKSVKLPPMKKPVVDTQIMSMARNHERNCKNNAWRPRKFYSPVAPRMHGGVLNHFAHLRREADKFTNAVDVLVFSDGGLGGLNLEGMSVFKFPAGSSFGEAMWYANAGALEFLKPKNIVLCMNLGHDLHEKSGIPAMEKLVEDIRRVMKIKKLKAKLILMPAIPGGVNSEDEMRKRNLRFDAAVSKLADGKNVLWCDYTEDFYTKDDGRVRDEYQKGEFNLTPAAFARIAEALKATIESGKSSSREIVPPPYPERELTIMSYNVRYMQGGMDDFWEPGRAVEVIRRVRPDILGIQECNRNASWTFGIDGPTALGHMIAPLWRNEFGAGHRDPETKEEEGVAVFALEDAVSVKRLALPDKKKYGRMFLAVEYPEFWVANSHFSLHEDMRLKGVEVIAEFAKTVDKPLFFMGDWNAQPNTATMAEIRKHFKILTDESVPTFSSARPHAAIDYIAVDKAHADKVKVKSFNVLHEPYASDHMPLVLKVTLEK